jgi:hypothetical protein
MPLRLPDFVPPLNGYEKRRNFVIEKETEKKE